MSCRALLLGTFLAVIPAVAVGQEKVNDFQPGAIPREDLPTRWAYDYDFSDVDIDVVERWLGFAGIRSPMRVAGKVSGWIWAQPSRQGWFDFGDYRVEGEFRTPLLSIEAWKIRDALIRFGYRDQKWYIGEATGELQHTRMGNDAVVGTAAFTAILPMVADAQVELEGSLTHVSLPQLLTVFGFEKLEASGLGKVTLRGNTALKDLANPNRWTASGNIELEDASIEGSPELQLFSQWQLKNGTIDSDRTLVSLLNNKWEIAASIDTSRPWQWLASLPPQSVQITPKLLERLGMSEFSGVSGTIQLDGEAKGQLLSGDIEGELSVASDVLTVFGNELREVVLSLHLFEDRLAIELQSGRLYDAPVSGRAEATISKTSVDRPSDLFLTPKSASFRIDGLQLERVAAQGLSVPISGIGDFEISLDSGVDSSWDWTAWTIAVVGNLDDVIVEPVQLGDMEVRLKKSAGSSYFFADASNSITNASWNLQGRVRPWPWNLLDYSLTAEIVSYPIHVQVIEGGSPNDLVRFIPSGRLELSGDSMRIARRGKFDFSNVRIDRGKSTAVVKRLNGTVSEETIEVKSASFDALGGSIEANGVWQRQNAGEHSLQIVGSNLQVGQLSVFFPAPWTNSFSGKADLHLTMSRSARWQTWLEGWAGAGSVSTEDLRFRRTRLGQLVVQAVIDPDQWSLKADGQLLSGKLVASGLVRPTHLSATSLETADLFEEVELEFAWLDAKIDRLVPLWQSLDSARDFQGLASIKGRLDWSSEEGLRTRSETMITALAYRGERLARHLQVETESVDSLLVIKRIHGELAHGRVSGQGELQVSPSPRGELRFNADHVELRELAQILDLSLADNFIGQADVQGELQWRDEISFSGNAALSHSIVFGVPLERVHSQVRVKLSADGKSLLVRCPSIRGQAFGGNLNGVLTARYSSAWSLDSQFRVSQGDVTKVSKFAGVERVLGEGKFDGDLTLVSSRMRTLDDLQGRLRMVFRETDAQSLPLISEISRYTPLLQLPNSDFQRGLLRADIGHGQLRVRELYLWGEQLWLTAGGNVSLRGGGLDMELIIYTGPGFEQQVAAGLLANLIQGSVPAITAVSQLNRLISNRALFLNVRGNTSRPVLSPKPVRTISRIALQSILQQAVPISTTVGSQLGIERSRTSVGGP